MKLQHLEFGGRTYVGFYIEVPESTNKASQLIRLHGAENAGLPPRRLADVPKGKTLVCVVRNGLFDAAGIVYSEAELEAFKETRPGRPRTWLLMETEKLCQLKPEIAEHLRGERSWHA